MPDDPPPHLRVLIADADQHRIAEIAGVISGLGHTVVARLLDVSEIADATRRENPDVAIVGVDDKGEQSHALALISAIVKQAACPVIADLQTDDDSFIEKAARRGIFAYVQHGGQPKMEHAIDIVLNRYAEFSRLHVALRTGATIEQAKGILMERHGISADEAFAELRTRARNTNQSVFDVADAVTLSYPLFKSRLSDAD
ncbi:MAG TPA: ANTAR domain-containing protein [Solirubrobacteraceae bacterium]|nr:ANTAR domain-containing protein [Solirubrobacteraceae bacterium]